MAPKVTATSPKTKKPKFQVREISDEERRAKTSSNHEEWRKFLQLALTKNIEITCEDYREARLLAQKLTSVRSYYGYAVKIQHRGKGIFLSPKDPPVDLEVVELDPAVP